MGLFDRLSSLIKANLNDLISKAEEPEKLLEQSILDMRSQLAKAKQQVAAAIADEKRLRDQADTEFKQAGEWEQRAMLAIQQNRDDLARQALMRQQEHGEHAAVTDRDLAEPSGRDGEAQVVAPRPERQDRRSKAQEESAACPRTSCGSAARIQNTMSGLSEKSAFEAFSRMEEKIEQNERRLAASAEIEEEFSGDRLQSDFKKLEKAAGGMSAEARLLELKAEDGHVAGGRLTGGEAVAEGCVGLV